MDGEINTPAVAFPAAEMRPMAGTTELAVAEAVARSDSRPEKVSCVLNEVYQSIGGQAVSLELVRRLHSGTREWLLQQAAQHFCPDLNWFEASCSYCGQPYDLSLSLTDAARHLPNNVGTEIEVETSLGSRSFMLPNGEHEEAFARAVCEGDPRVLFAALCGSSEQAESESLQFNEHDLSLIDEALEEASPDISDETRTICPSCGVLTTARFDPLLFAFPREGGILQEIHLIANAYGWSHDQILQLSVRHRSCYAAMISRDRRHTTRSNNDRPA